MAERFRTRQRAFREQEIVRAARTVLADVGCRAFTMHQVAARMGVSKATLYQHFRSRDELIRRCVDEACREAIEEADAEAMRGPASRRLKRATKLLVHRCLGVDGAEGDPIPCCLAEVECPFLDWSEVESFLGKLGARGFGEGLSLGQALRALSASVFQRRRARGERPTAADVEGLIRFLFSRG